MINLILLILAYFLGAIPSAYLFGRLLKGLDVRKIGSGNVGTMNVLRNVGFLPGLMTFVVDVAKGALAAYLAAVYGTWPFLILPAALLAVLGHNYNLFLKFKGGKGLACLIGSMLVISSLSIVFMFAVVGVIAVLIRDANTAAGIGVFSLPFFLWFLEGHWFFPVFGVAIALLVASKHRGDFHNYSERRKKMA
ncbi:MAG: glycerol-3-phosphate acyltransferase [Bacillota bacterium]|nr:glycerol-3-phosphate acyltransferase [Bacillota bacterium]